MFKKGRIGFFLLYFVGIFFKKNQPTYYMPVHQDDHYKDITELYDAYQVQFKKWAKWHFPQYDSLVHEDVFHDALIIYWENYKKGKFQDLTAPLINLLIGIAYNLFRKMGSKQVLEFVEQMPETERTAVQSVLEDIIGEETSAEQKIWLNGAFCQLGGECQRLLTLFYVEQKKINEITEIMGYKNNNVASVMKSRCLKTLKEILENHGKPK
jgi:RNA polymerase sigma factor (sigma-70 family)